MSKRENIGIESMDSILNKNDEHIRAVKDINDAHFNETHQLKKAIIEKYLKWFQNVFNVKKLHRLLCFDIF